MGYNISIGNAVPNFSKDEEELHAWWGVKIERLHHAPIFPNDELTGNSNARHPSYIAWHDFCREAGIHELFYSEDDGLMRQHPGCFPLKDVHLEAVKLEIKKRKILSDKPPGFASSEKNDDGSYVDEDKYDAVLARLLWLEFWIDWALKNSETPAIENR